MDLKELLGEELYKQVTEKAGDHKLAVVSDGNWFPKSKFDEVNEAKKSLEAALKDRDKQLEDLKKSAGDNKVLQEQIAQLQAENKTAKEKYEAELKELRTNTALKLALNGKVHDPDLVLGLLDKSKIELDEAGNVKAGFDDQIKALQQSKAFLFVPEKEDKGFQFRGLKPADGSGGGNEQQQPNLGKQLAAQNKQTGDAMQQAQANYFK
ncbi:phage scaffolding protein [Brevibacillus massiliensis]|uniref:phage scaffolding protein n=1 Tax=Brevibacillus massiliensis TaxID=1118054 RepID=UPI0002D2B738|nr:phage scaffolding protein [Brevibacillus massiliensis]